MRRIPLIAPHVRDAAGHSLRTRRGASAGVRRCSSSVDYTCRTICGPALAIAAGALAADRAAIPARITGSSRSAWIRRTARRMPAEWCRGRIADPAVAQATTVLTGGAGSKRAHRGGRLSLDYDAEHRPVRASRRRAGADRRRAGRPRRCRALPSTRRTCVSPWSRPARVASEPQRPPRRCSVTASIPCTASTRRHPADPADCRRAHG